MNLLQKVCRAICIAEGVDPDLECYGLGKIIPVGEIRKAWEVRRAPALSAIDAVWKHRKDLEK